MKKIQFGDSASYREWQYTFAPEVNFLSHTKAVLVQGKSLRMDWNAATT